MQCFKLPSIQPKGKLYFVFFACRGKYAGRYAEIRADNLDNARCLAWKRYGVGEVARIENNEERARAHIAAYRLDEIVSADVGASPSGKGTGL